MIKKITLGDFATFERAKKGEIYEVGTVAIQVSATQGEIIYLKKAGEVEAKYVIINQTKMMPKFLEYVMNRGKDLFMAKYKSGLNIQVADLNFFEVEYINMKQQKEIVMMIEHIEREEEIVKKELEGYEGLKKRMLKEMFV